MISSVRFHTLGSSGVYSYILGSGQAVQRSGCRYGDVEGTLPVHLQQNRETDPLLNIHRFILLGIRNLSPRTPSVPCPT